MCVLGGGGGGAGESPCKEIDPEDIKRDFPSPKLPSVISSDMDENNKRLHCARI